ncbi:MAG TPA: hypothetical protein VKU41_07410 [Polyangiaceae bacterium]|nr:hypothetical protein [Polyangiaceae bacterium]
MKIAVMACPRPSPNALDTLAAMVAADPYAGEFESTVQFDGFAPHGTVEGLTVVEHAKQSVRSPRQRAIYNYVRCLAEHPDVIVEDDVVFTSGWVGKLRRAIEHTGGEVPILGYNRFGVEGWHPAGEKLWGSLLMWWPKALVGRAIRGLLLRLDDASFEAGADEAIGETFDRIWCISPSIVQHAGDVSIINPGHGVRRATDFQP